MNSSPEEHRTPPPSQPGSVPVTLPTIPPQVSYAILGLTIFVYLLQLLSNFILGYDLPIGLGAKANEFIRAGQLWRFFTPMLLHGSILHIGFNMYALFIFGTGLERRYGHGRFLLLYILSGFAGSVFSFLFSSAYSIGASGAIFGLIGAEGIFLYQNRKLFGSQARQAIGNILFVVVFNLFLGLQPGIDNWGHIGGLVGGLIFAWFAGPHWELEGIFPSFQLVDRRSGRDVLLGGAIVTIIFSTLAVLGILSPFAQ
jgi:rhomboid protease GluP